ncbi:MAG: glycosyltransferase family 9 protein [Alphaproteobacteria bacterium]|nr:glycosyltransferase family 9 protein [Alphaproteobacteria bacterium]
MPGAGPRILAIKHGALGDAVLAIGALQAIRRHHAGAHLALLTAAPAVELLAASGLFDETLVDARAGLTALGANATVLAWLVRGAFRTVYDLQASSRTRRYRRFLAAMRPRTVWHVLPAARAGEHAADRLAQCLAAAQIPGPWPADLDFLDAAPEPFWPTAPFALLLPGGSARHPAKRWPPERFGAICNNLADEGIMPVLLGTEADRAACHKVGAGAPGVLDLCGRTSLASLAGLGRRAVVALGNDSGPLHLLAQLGCPTLAIFGPGGDPGRSAPRGPRAAWIGAADTGWPEAGDVWSRLILIRQTA